MSVLLPVFAGQVITKWSKPETTHTSYTFILIAYKYIHFLSCFLLFPIACLKYIINFLTFLMLFPNNNCLYKCNFLLLYIIF
jgi:hypothetical protein